MDREALKKAYTTAAIVSGAIITAIVFYAAVVEVLAHMGHKPPLVPPAAHAVKYALYIVAVSVLLFLKIIGARFSGGSASPGEALKSLRTLAIAKAAACEVPAVCGLMLFILTGGRADFYMLTIFSVGLEIYHFPRLQRWEERLRGDFGQL